jgi:hypothetical protein
MDHWSITPPAGGAAVADAAAAAVYEMNLRAEQLERRAAGQRAIADWATRDADLCEQTARIYRGAVQRMPGTPLLPDAADVRRLDGRPGMDLGVVLLGPPADATTEQLRAYEQLMQALNVLSMDEIHRARGLRREGQATLSTQQLDPEDVPQPDPLTATPAEETGGLPVVPARLPRRAQGGRYVRDPDRGKAADQLPQRERGAALDLVQAEHPRPPHAVDSCATPSCRRPIRGGEGSWEHVDTGQRLCDVGDLLGPVALPASIAAARLEQAGRTQPDAVSEGQPAAEAGEPTSGEIWDRRAKYPVVPAVDAPVPGPEAAQVRVCDLGEGRTDGFVQAVTAERQVDGTESGEPRG